MASTPMPAAFVGHGSPMNALDDNRWAHRFEDAAREAMTTEPQKVASLGEHADYDMAAPTPDHFLPLVYIAALAEQCGRPAKVLVDGFFAGGISMTSYVLDADCRAQTGDAVAASLPDPSVIPPEKTNT